MSASASGGEAPWHSCEGHACCYDRTTPSVGDGVSGCLSIERSRFYPSRAEATAVRTVAGAALLARALSLGALGRRRQLLARGAAPRLLRALPEARAVIDAEAPEMSEAALHRHQRDARCRVSRAAEEALACMLEAPRAQELHRGAAAPATEARLDGPHAPPRHRRQLGEGDRLQNVAHEVVLDPAEVARLRSDRARVEPLGMVVRLAQDQVEQEPFEQAVGDDRGAQQGAALVQLGHEKIEEGDRTCAEIGVDREALVEDERSTTRDAEQRCER